MRLIIPILWVVCFTACIQDSPPPKPSPYAPGQRLSNSRGQRLVILDDARRPSLKVRARRDRRKVYDAAQKKLGVVKTRTKIEGKKKVTTLTIESVNPKEARRQITITDTPDRVEIQPHLVLQKQDDQWVIQALPDHATIALLDIPMPERKPGRTISLRTSIRDKAPTIGRQKDQMLEIERDRKVLFNGYASQVTLDELLLMSHPDAKQRPLSWVALAMAWRTLLEHHR